jgi:peroxiredoxin
VNRPGLVAFVLGLLGLVAGWLAHQHLSPAGTPPAVLLPDPAPPERRPDFSLPDLDGNLRHISEWNGKLLVVNFWATWCPPCRQEIPGFITLQARYADQGVQFLGIAVDRPEAAAELAAELGINYPNLVGEADAMAVNEAFGNSIGALPFTAVVDRSGAIVFSHRGALSEAETEAQLRRLL